MRTMFHLICWLFMLGSLINATILKLENTKPTAKCAKFMESHEMIDMDIGRKLSDRRIQQKQQPNILLLGDSTLRNKFTWAILIGLNNSIEYQDWSHLTDETMDNPQNLMHIRNDRNITLDWVDAVVWNIGLHQMHLHPIRERESNVSTLIQYEELLRKVADVLHKETIAKGKLIYYKLSNYVCQNRFEEPYYSASKHWMNKPTRTMLPNYALQMNQVGTSFLNYIEKKVMREYGIPMLSSMTHGSCDCTKGGNARHYPSLVPHFWEQLVVRVIADKQVADKQQVL